MRWRIPAVALVFLTLPVTAADGGKYELVGDALDWYSRWLRPAADPLELQTCRGIHSGSSYQFRCDPMAVVFNVLAEDDDSCSIVSMRPSIRGVPDLNFGVIIPRKPGTQRATQDPAMTTRESKAHSRSCSALQFGAGTFEFSVLPTATPVNDDLSRDASNAALAYHDRIADHGCLLRSPKVRSGDPFFHVYVEYAGKLREVWEFAIGDGEPADSPQWSYYPKRGGFPPGTTLRLRSSEPWYAISRPEDRAEAKGASGDSTGR